MNVKARKTKHSIYIVVTRNIYNPSTKKSKTVILYNARAIEFEESEFRRSIKAKAPGISIDDNELAKARDEIQAACQEDARLKLCSALKIIRKSGVNPAISKIVATLASLQ